MAPVCFRHGKFTHQHYFIREIANNFLMAQMTPNKQLRFALKHVGVLRFEVRSSGRGRKETRVSLEVVNVVVSAGLSVCAADLLGFSAVSRAEDGPEIEKYPASGSCGGKCLVGVKGQRSDWADWLETLAGSSKSASRRLQANGISKGETPPTSLFMRYQALARLANKVGGECINSKQRKHTD